MHATGIVHLALDHAGAVGRHDPAQLGDRQIGPMLGQPLAQPNPSTPIAAVAGYRSSGDPYYSDPIRAPFSATERFISGTTNTSAAVTTASTQNTSK